MPMYKEHTITGGKLNVLGVYVYTSLVFIMSD